VIEILILSEVELGVFAWPSISGIQVIVKRSLQNWCMTCSSWKVERQPTVQAEHLNMQRRHPISLWHNLGIKQAAASLYLALLEAQECYDFIQEETIQC
jgi:hypothetical protein